MDLARVHKKLAEAGYFLGLLMEQEPRIVGDKEPFDFVLSAFHNAGRTVDYRLCHEHKAAYKPWRKAWNARLTPDENALIKFMIDDRNLEVHESGSSRIVGQEGVEFGIGEHRLPGRGGMISYSGPPDMTPAVLYRPTYGFTINGANHKATDACRDYLALLQRMVCEFEAAHP